MLIKCNICGEEKSEDNFYKRKDCKDGYRKQCIECKKELDRKKYSKNKEAFKKKNKLFYEINKDKINEKRREKYKKDPQKYNTSSKRYAEEHREELRLYSKKYREDNYEIVNKRRRESYHKKMEDPLYKTKIKLRSSINNYLHNKGVKKNKRTKEILGCSLEEFKIYIENKFQEGMSWENKGEWHLDHIIPLASAKSENEIIKLCHYTNFQPLWALDNIRKGAKYENIRETHPIC